MLKIGRRVKGVKKVRLGDEGWKWVGKNLVWSQTFSNPAARQYFYLTRQNNFITWLKNFRGWLLKLFTRV